MIQNFKTALNNLSSKTYCLRSIFHSLRSKVYGLWSMVYGQNKGLTLIEVLLAVSILAVGIVGVLRAYASSVATLEIGQYNIDAVSLMKQKMADVEQAILEEEKISQGSERGGFDEPMEDFLWEREISSTETEGLNELTLVVSHKYNPRTFSLKTYVVDKEEEEE